jgi:hypothetical protein
VTGSVYQRVLGADFNRLVPELRGYFSGSDAALTGEGSGAFEVAGSQRRWMRPVLAYLGWRHILFPEYARDVPFVVRNRPGADGSLSAERVLSFGARTRILEDTMRVVNGELHDFLGRRRGLEVRLIVSVDESGFLAMRSDRLWLHLLGARIRLPRFATVTIDESRADGRQHVDVRLMSPLLGTWLRYAGAFDYRYVSSR